MTISDVDIDRARRHLGYLQVTIASSYHFGVPAVTQIQFMFEDAVRRLLPVALPHFIKLLDQLDCIEERLFEASGDLFAKRIDSLEINLDQPDALDREYYRWGCRLADALGVTPYPFSERYRLLMQGGLSGGKAGNIRVSR